MTNMENNIVWNTLPPFRPVEKGQDNYINYGYIKKNSKERRKAFRQIRKYGFDLSETWGLDYTIIRWLSDHFPENFNFFGSPDNWDEYDKLGNKLETIDYKNSEERYNSFLKYLENFLANANNDQLKEISDFCSPRLRALAKYAHGYPAFDCSSLEEWKDLIIEMAEHFENGAYSPNFIKFFFNLWDLYSPIIKTNTFNTSYLLFKVFTVNNSQPRWRHGQTTFNVIDMFYNIARYIQFNEHLDCFYDDHKSIEFISKAIELIKNGYK